MIAEIKSIKLQVGERELELTELEARQLYNTLAALFGRPVPVVYPPPIVVPMQPVAPPYTPWVTYCQT